MIHLVHDFDGEIVLVFGGGRVGARRARTFCDADVVVVSPAFVDASFSGASLVRADPTVDDAREMIVRAEPVLVVLATDDGEFNADVAAEANEFGSLVNRADRPAAGPNAVDVPATARDGAVVTSVSTGGRNPALSVHLRGRLKEELRGSGELARVTGDLRTDLRDRGVEPELRREALRAVVENDQLWEAARNGEPVGPLAARTIEAFLVRSRAGEDGDE